MGGYVSDDPKLRWPYEDHEQIIKSGKHIDREFVLDLLEKLKKQNEYAQKISAYNTTLKTDNEMLKNENVFLTDLLNSEEGGLNETNKATNQ